VQADILDRGPDNRQATGLGREHVNLVGTLSHIAKETFDSVRRLNVTMHDLRKRVKRQHMLLVLSQTAHRFGIALSILGFEGSQLGQTSASILRQYAVHSAGTVQRPAYGTDLPDLWAP